MLKKVMLSKYITFKARSFLSVISLEGGGKETYGITLQRNKSNSEVKNSHGVLKV